jgi:hypothetical protein
VQLSANASGDKEHSETARLAKAIMRLFMQATQVEELFSEFSRFCTSVTTWNKSILDQVLDVVSALNLSMDPQHLNATSTTECGIVEEGAYHWCCDAR